MTEQPTPPRHSRYAGDVSRELHDRAGFWGQWEADDKAAEYAAKQTEAFAANQELRGDAPAPNDYHPGQPHETLKEYVNVGLNPSDINVAGEKATELANWLQDMRAQTDQTLNKESHAWRGDAAEAAHGFLKATSTSMDNTSNGAELVATQYAQQAQAAEHAKNSMPEPIPFDPGTEENNIRSQLAQDSSMTGVMRAAGMMDAAEAKQRASQDRHQEAVRVMNTMDQNYHQSAQTQPSFAPPPQPGGDQATAPTAAGPSIGGLGDGFRGATGGAPAPGPVSGGGFNSPPASGIGVPGSGGVPGTSPGSGSAGGFGVVPAAGAPGNAGDRSRAPRGTGTPGGNRAGARVTGGATPPRAPRSAANSGSALGKPIGIGGKPGSGGGGRGGPVTGGKSGSGGPGAPGAKGTAGEPLGQGKSTGAANPGRASEVTRGGAAAAKAAKGGAGMPFAPGGGKGKSGDDQDRKAPHYLKDPDPEDTFGVTSPRDAEGNKPTAPVIGDVGK